MFHFLRDFEFDRLSFWLGFIAGTLLWWLLGRLRPLAARLLESMRESAQLSKLGATAVTEIRLRNDVMHHAQGLHLAAPLFSLDEIAVTPQLLAAPVLTEPGVTPPPSDIVEHVLPYLLDAPELRSFYKAPVFTLLEALGGNAHILVVGHPGSGKTVALAHLSAQIALGQHLPEHLKNALPLLVHAADLVLPPPDPENFLVPLVGAISHICPSLTVARLEKFLPPVLSSGRAILILDGLDELPPPDVKIRAEYIEGLLQKYPTIRLVATASPDFVDGLTKLGCIPLALASWDETRRGELINRWSDLWIAHIGPLTDGADAVDPVLLNAWLINDHTILSPLELTLKIWAIYSGDLPGPRISDWIEAYLVRMALDVPKGRPALELLARQALLSEKPIFTQREAEGWLTEIEPPPPPPQEPADNPQEGEASWPPPLESKKSEATEVKPIRDSRVLPALLERGLIAPHIDGKFTFIHSCLLSYLAGCSLAESSAADGMQKMARWITATLALGFFAARCEDPAPPLRPFLDASNDPLFRETFVAARWLRYAPENLSWRASLMRQLARILQNENYPLALRARALSALALSGTSGVETLFRQSLSSSDSGSRLLAALGCGLLQDLKAVPNMKALVQEAHPAVRRAACLALVATGNQMAMETVADALLHGDEDLRRIAAEALANNTEEGHPTLKEGATIDDLLVRHATAYGLRRVRQDWATLTLQQMQVSDEQWLVKDTATTLLDELNKPDPHLPRALPDLTETPWLIAFAGERGIGISPGKPALDLLMLALKEGKEEQRLAALEYLARYGESSALPNVLDVYTASQGELRESAFNTLWHISVSEYVG
jgi:HEAT repeat protein